MMDIQVEERDSREQEKGSEDMEEKE